MWTCLLDKRTKARKQHRCLCCNQLILKGEVYHTRTGVEEGEGFFTMRMHLECANATSDWTTDDWETFSAGTMDRPETL